MAEMLTYTSTDPRTDEELLSLIHNGDPKDDDVKVAKEILVIRYRGLVRKIAYKYQLRGGGDINDLIQEATLGLLKAIDNYEEDKDKAFVVFATACVSNKVKDAVRAYGAIKNSVLNNADSITFTDSSEEKFAEVLASRDPLAAHIGEEDDSDFYEQMGKVLSKKQFAVMQLYLAGYNYAEIALKLDIGVKSVDNALTTAKNKFKKIYLSLADKKGAK